MVIYKVEPETWVYSSDHYIAHHIHGPLTDYMQKTLLS